ncbi:MAG: hypothetical protein EON98_00105 [Chitinophagaceae bacterium]|nr:MAG: hypothetical protein EON98_00105 [Chitinophagaceae bacterium]
MLKYLLLWFPMLFIAVVNGTLREFFIKKYTSDLTAHQLSTISLLAFFTLYIAFVIQTFPPISAAQAIKIGLIWLFFTLLFEFGFGRWRGNSWETLLADYNLLNGKIWILIPLWVALAPYILYHLLKR